MGTSEGEKNRIGFWGYVALGVVFGVVALEFFPPLFGVLSVFAGVMVFRRHSERGGLAVILWGVLTGSIGWYYGIFGQLPF